MIFFEYLYYFSLGLLFGSILATMIEYTLIP